MKSAPEKVNEVIEPVVIGLGYELLGIEWVAQGKHSLLRVYIDQEQGIQIEDCAKVGHQLNGVLDVEDVIPNKYQLEISSPGLDRPLFTEQHFEQQIGNQVTVKCVVPVEGKRKFKGIIVSVQEGVVQLSCEGEMVNIPFTGIQKANIVPEF